MFNFFRHALSTTRAGPQATQQEARQQVFQATLASHGKRWFAACLRITQNVAQAEDALQDALLRAWKEYAQFRADAELHTWIQRIAVRSAIDQLRAQQRFTELEAESEQHSCGTDLAQLALAKLQMDAALSRAMLQLTRQERICFELKHGEQWSLQEIADELAISLNSTKQALFRALRKLRAALHQPLSNQ